ncbi:MAG: thioredoxin fold domain-containing protein [Paludibacteraceae bacterium]|nr:thioredoxin fold domain-containing protein [Paludibacteraceae bacterium]
MKNIFRTIIALLSLACCTPKDGVETLARVKTSKEEAKKEAELPSISYKEFLDNIYDFEHDSTQTWSNKSGRPVVIDFYATWCAPCKKLGPSLLELSNKYTGQVDFYKVDTEKEERLAMAFNVSSVPTLMFIPKEGDPYLSIGYISKGEINQIIKELVKY